jgi:hypothetical protein
MAFGAALGGVIYGYMFWSCFWGFPTVWRWWRSVATKLYDLFNRVEFTTIVTVLVVPFGLLLLPLAFAGVLLYFYSLFGLAFLQLLWRRRLSVPANAKDRKGNAPRNRFPCVSSGSEYFLQSRRARGCHTGPAITIALKQTAASSSELGVHEIDSVVSLVIYSALIAINLIAIVRVAHRSIAGILSGVLHLSIGVLHVYRLIKPFRFEVFGHPWPLNASCVKY